MNDDLLVRLFYAAQGNITQFRIKARELLASSDAQAGGGKDEAVPVGYAGGMPGTSGGFTMAAFDASTVPPGSALYTAPQAECAPHEGLTDERIREIIEEFDGGSWVDGKYRIDMMRIARAIEQAAKEKANG
jgi:hypothetical protein